jgi:hypothetical protein
MSSYARLIELAARHERPVIGHDVTVAITSRPMLLGRGVTATGVVDEAVAPPRRISCDECTMRASSACGDCVVTFICGREPDDAVIIDAAEERALRLLAGAGLVPGLRHARTVGDVW